MTVLPYIVIGGIAFYYLYENHHPDKTTVPDIDLKQEIEKHRENVPMIADETTMTKPKLLPIPVSVGRSLRPAEPPLNPNIRIKNTYEGTDIVRNPLLNDNIPSNQSMSNSWNKGGPVFARMPNMRANPNMHSPFTRAIHQNYIVAKF